MDIQLYVDEIKRLKQEAKVLPEDNPATLLEKIEIFTKVFTLEGRVAAEYALLYKKIRITRKRAYAEAYKIAKAPKAMNAELEIEEIEELEAEHYADMHRYRNDFDATREIIHALKLKMRVDFENGTIGSRYGG